MAERPHVVIIGGGFAGMNAAKELRKEELNITLVDKQNYHLFLPLLYQVAIAGLSPGDIAAPLRAIFRKDKNVRTLMGDVKAIDVDQRTIYYDNNESLTYDALLVATGAQYNYFGNEEWREKAPGMDGLESALAIRRQVLAAYEAAEQESDAERRRALMTFVIVGAGPTGVELAGAIAEMATHTLREDFRHTDPEETRVLLIEMADRVLTPFPPKLSQAAEASLHKLGVVVRTGTKVVDLGEDYVTVEDKDGETESISTHTVMWAAGVKASSLATELQERTGIEQDRSGRLKVESDLSVPNYPNIFVAGDMVYFEDKDGSPLPGVAPVAMQQGKHAARQIERILLDGKETEPFRYVDKGTMATIGRAAAVADLNFIQVSGFIAWLMWLFIHLMYLVGFRNRLSVFMEWMWNYITYGRGARLIVRQTERVKRLDHRAP